jgi:ACR3 family arsenite efflux pump ArsB
MNKLILPLFIFISIPFFMVQAAKKSIEKMKRRTYASNKLKQLAW